MQDTGTLIVIWGFSLICVLPFIVLGLLIMRSKSSKPLPRLRIHNQIQYYEDYPFIDLPGVDQDWPPYH